MKGTKNMKMMRIKEHDVNVGCAYTRLTHSTAATVTNSKQVSWSAYLCSASPVDEFVTPLREAQNSSNTHTRDQP